MPRPKKEENALVRVVAEQSLAPIDRLNLSQSQLETFRNTEKRIAAAAARLDMLDREILGLKQKINSTQESKRMKELKGLKKAVTSIYKDSASAYNGALELALSEVEGKTLSEKIQRIYSILKIS